MDLHTGHPNYGCVWIPAYSRDLNNKLVWYSEGPNLFSCWMVCFSSHFKLKVSDKPWPEKRTNLTVLDCFLGHMLRDWWFEKPIFNSQLTEWFHYSNVGNSNPHCIKCPVFKWSYHLNTRHLPSLWLKGQFLVWFSSKVLKMRPYSPEFEWSV